MFAYPEHIDGAMRRLSASLVAGRGFRGLPGNDFAAKAAAFMAELNAVHPFREGNGRTQMMFLGLLATRAGHPLDLVRLDPERTLAAFIGSFQTGDTAPLAEVIADLLP